MPGRRDPAAYPVVEEYQIAFLRDNFFLPGVTSEITLANVPHEECNETKVGLED
ncbi:MAG: hypothetical protein WCA20_19355 [Candidatus Sulfotelmatobacter sp.]